MYLVDWFFFLIKNRAVLAILFSTRKIVDGQENASSILLLDMFKSKTASDLHWDFPSLKSRANSKWEVFSVQWRNTGNCLLRKQICGLSKNLMIYFFVCVIKVWYKTEKNITFMLYVSRPHDHFCFGGNVCKAVHNMALILGAYKSGQSIVF